jgi:hypothetical protein
MKEMKVIGRIHQPNKINHSRLITDKKVDKIAKTKRLYVTIGTIAVIFGVITLLAQSYLWGIFWLIFGGMFFISAKNYNGKDCVEYDSMFDDMFDVKTDPAYCNVPGNIFYYSCHND